jgi:hypothetical protein
MITAAFCTTCWRSAPPNERVHHSSWTRTHRAEQIILTYSKLVGARGYSWKDDENQAVAASESTTRDIFA